MVPSAPWLLPSECEMGQTNFGTFAVAAGFLFFYLFDRNFLAHNGPRGCKLPYF